jgi:hypothetical protein
VGKFPRFYKSYSLKSKADKSKVYANDSIALNVDSTKILPAKILIKIYCNAQ